MTKSVSQVCQIPLRKAQIEILKQVKNGKINLLVAPTGVGKSYVAAHLASAQGGAMIITPNRALQSQYFGEIDLANLWGKAHYHCDRYNTSCDKCDEAFADEIAHLNPKKEADAKKIKEIALLHEEECEYIKERRHFTGTKFGVSGVEICYFGIRNKSRCLIVDEAHNLINKLTNLSGSKISSNSSLFGEIFKDVNEKFSRQKINFESFIESCIELAEPHVKDTNEARELKKKNYVQRLVNIKENISFYSYEISWNKNKIPSTEIKKLNFKYEFQTLVKDFDQVFLMSATLPDIHLFCSILGINKDEVNVAKVESPFSPNNVKVFCYTEVLLTAVNYEKNIKRSVEILGEILDKEPWRGIIHCTSFTQINDIRKLISMRHVHRLIFDDQGKDKDELLEELKQKPDGVIISASAHEGIDLKGNLGIFSITFKAPYPVWSPWVQAMNSRYPNYYHSQALSRFIQGLGRCIRTFDDTANIYLVDLRCGRFIYDPEIPSNIRLAEKTVHRLKEAS